MSTSKEQFVDKEDERFDKCIESLHSIFETFDIYQSVVICPDKWLTRLHTAMKEQDYPVVLFDDTEGIQSFMQTHSRCLLVAEKEVVDFRECAVIVCPHVNVVISMGAFDADDFESIFDKLGVTFLVA